MSQNVLFLFVVGDGMLLLMGLESIAAGHVTRLMGQHFFSFLKGKLCAPYSDCTLRIIFTFVCCVVV